MPIYEFQCKNCKKVTEKLVTMDTEEIMCTFCGKTAHKIMSAPSDPVIHGYNANNRYSNVKDTKKNERKKPDH